MSLLFTSEPLPEIKDPTLDKYLDLILPIVRQKSEDISETEYYASMDGKSWEMVSDEPGFLESVKYYFYPITDRGFGRFEKTINGLGDVGSWNKHDDVNRIIIEFNAKQGPMRFHYNLVFLSINYLILKLDSNKSTKNKYLVLGYEGHIHGLSWIEFVETFFYDTRPVSYFNAVLIAIVLLVFISAFISI